MVADCRLIGRRTLPNQPEPQETVHFTARVRLSKQTPTAVTGKTPQMSADSIIEAADIYRVYFHGPAYQVLERAWWDGKRMVGADGQRPARQSPAVRSADAHGAAADRALLPDRRPLGNELSKTGWVCHWRSTKFRCCVRRPWRRASCMRSSLPIRTKEASMPKSWTRKGIATCGSSATARWRCPTASMPKPSKHCTPSLA